MNDVKYGCGALIVNDKGEVLLLLRGGNSRNDLGLWSQPGGEIDDEVSSLNEKIVQKNIKREIKEEIGVDINISKFLATTHHTFKQQKWTAYSYLASISHGVPEICEASKHDDLRWFPISKLPENINQVTKESVAEYLRGRNNLKEDNVFVAPSSSNQGYVK